MSLLYAAGERPGRGEIARILHDAGVGVLQDEFVITAGGLTFELHGLAPGSPTPLPPGRHFFGMVDNRGSYPFEAIALLAGPAALPPNSPLPLVVAKARMAQAIVAGSRARALCWKPAASWMEAAYFARAAGNWLTGGPFPALGLTAIARRENGGLISDGLSFFTGQELQVDPRRDEHATDTVKLAVRTIDFLVRQGRLIEPRSFVGPGEELLTAEPSLDGAIVRLRRAA